MLLAKIAYIPLQTLQSSLRMRNIKWPVLYRCPQNHM